MMKTRYKILGLLLFVSTIGSAQEKQFFTIKTNVKISSDQTTKTSTSASFEATFLDLSKITSLSTGKNSFFVEVEKNCKMHLVNREKSAAVTEADFTALNELISKYDVAYFYNDVPSECENIAGKIFPITISGL